MNPDALTIVLSAILANILLATAIVWNLVRSRRGPRTRPAAWPRPVAASPVARPRSVVAQPKSRRGPLRVIGDLIDASIAMYLFRRALGRPTEPRAKGSNASLASVDEEIIASRIGSITQSPPIVRRPTRLIVAGSTTKAAGAAQGVGPSPIDRGRLYQDTFLAVAGVAAALLIVVALLPSLGQGGGEVLSATGTPEGSANVVVTASPSPSGDATVVTPTPEPVPSEGLEPFPSLEPIPTATRAPERTPKPVPRPSATLRPAVAPTPIPKPTSAPTPGTTPTSTTPKADFDCASIGATLTCDGALSLNAQTYEWLFEDDANTTSATGVTTSHTYATSGTKTVTLTVTGPGGIDTWTSLFDVIVP